jgi:hypothetical protein
LGIKVLFLVKGEQERRDESSFWAQDDKGLGIKALSCKRRIGKEG